MYQFSQNHTVHQFLFSEGSLTLFHELSEESEYWAKVRDFVTSVEDRPLRTLTQKQKDWLFKIKVDLLEEANK